MENLTSSHPNEYFPETIKKLFSVYKEKKNLVLIEGYYVSQSWTITVKLPEDVDNKKIIDLLVDMGGRFDAEKLEIVFSHSYGNQNQYITAYYLQMINHLNEISHREANSLSNQLRVFLTLNGYCPLEVINPSSVTHLTKQKNKDESSQENH